MNEILLSEEIKMSFERLKALVGDNEEAKALVSSLEQSSKDNIDKINTLERQAGDLKADLSKFKLGNNLVKNELGIDQLNEETLKEAIGKKGGGDEKLTAEIDNLKKLLDKAGEDKTTLANEYESKIQKMALDNEINSSGIGTLFANDEMYKLGLGLIKNGATYKDGQIIYTNEDGSTAYGTNNQPMTIKDKVESLKTNPSYAGLFRADSAGGSGTPPSTNGNSVGKKFSDYTSAELVALNRENPAEYARLRDASK